ncbi:MAG: GNAT family N-acetyltransferase [Armatimonadota bacterium]|nr:GNAT family N-acetyltransferase [Armatimonadota bacterium]
MAESDVPDIRRARPEDMPAVAEIYLAAFQDSVRDLGLEGIRPRAIADIMGICLAAEPEGFLVADVEGQPAGYVVCPSAVRRIRAAGVRRLPGILWRWLTGRYGVGLGAALRLAREKLMFWRHADLPEADVPARVLSLAVHPRGQGRGLGKALFSAALEYLRGQDARRVRLEVRPDNEVARHIYEKAGFRSVGQAHDTRAPWEVMVLDLEDTGG